LQGIIPYIAQTGTIIVSLSSADNSLLVQIAAPVPLGTLTLSNTLNALDNSAGGEAVFFISNRWNLPSLSKIISISFLSKSR
jgi:hypothetical protein